MDREQITSKWMVHGLRRLLEQINMHEENYYPGLEGVIAGETAISSIDEGLNYRGYSISDLAAQSTFLETAYLLLHGELPSQDFFADFQSIISTSAVLPDDLVQYLETIPLHAGCMDVLRTGVSALAHYDLEKNESSPTAIRSQAVRLLAQLPLLIAARHRHSLGLETLEPSPALTYPGNLLYLLTSEQPSAEEERALDVSLILYAEHEFNASTFTGRVVASTGSDLYSCLTASIGALKGPLHGGANERVMKVLEEVGSPDNAEEWVREELANKRRIMGFGHRVYKDGDPRAEILKHYCAQIAPTNELEEIADTVERIVLEEKGLKPNLDWPSARLYHYLGFDVDLFTPLFVVSRMTGWTAHIIEQVKNNRLIRPRSRFTGPALREFTPLQDRG